MAHAFGVMDGKTNKKVVTTPLSYRRAVLTARAMNNEAPDSDYHAYESSFECSAECAATHVGKPRPA